jgi:predicted kinase
MVCEAMIADPAWARLGPARRAELLLAALLHDVAKPVCTELRDGRTHHPYHSRRGESITRVLLWQAGLDYAARERIAHAVRYHQRPFFILDNDNPERTVTEIAETVVPAELAILARADSTGRICTDRQQQLDAIELFSETASEANCLQGPYPFRSGAARFEYFARPGRDRDYEPYQPDNLPTITVLSGLPDSGKSSWAATQNLPTICLDTIRQTTGTSPRDNQSPVINTARNQARNILRQHRSLIWDATNLSRQIRQNVINLAASYHTRVHIVAFEIHPEALEARNTSRPEPVPAAVIVRMLHHWEAPTTVECHRLEIHSTR